MLSSHLFAVVIVARRTRKRFAPMQHPINSDDAQQAGVDADTRAEATTSPPRRDPPAAEAARPRRRPGRPTAAMPIGELETRALVLRQARALFMQRGYASVTVEEVAAAVGVTKPTLYYHFGDKEGLYAAVLVDLMCEVGSYIARVVAKPATVRARLEEIALGYFLNANGTMEPMLRDAAQLIGEQHAAVIWRAYEEELLGPLTALLRDGTQRGEIRALDPHVLTRAFLGLLDVFTARDGKNARTPAQHQSVAKQAVALFLDGTAQPSAPDQA